VIKLINECQCNYKLIRQEKASSSEQTLSTRSFTFSTNYFTIL